MQQYVTDLDARDQSIRSENVDIMYTKIWYSTYASIKCCLLIDEVRNAEENINTLGKIKDFL